MQRNFRIALANNFYSEHVYLSQYDTNYNIIFEVIEKTSKAPINGMTAYFEGTRCDGLSFRYLIYSLNMGKVFHRANALKARIISTSARRATSAISCKLRRNFFSSII